MKDSTRRRSSSELSLLTCRIIVMMILTVNVLNAQDGVYYALIIYCKKSRLAYYLLYDIYFKSEWLYPECPRKDFRGIFTILNNYYRSSYNMLFETIKILI